MGFVEAWVFTGMGFVEARVFTGMGFLEAGVFTGLFPFSLSFSMMGYYPSVLSRRIG
jgi:hypothetical protein